MKRAPRVKKAASRPRRDPGRQDEAKQAPEVTPEPETDGPPTQASTDEAAPATDSAQEKPAEETPAEEALAEEALAEETPGEDGGTEKAPTEGRLSEEGPAEESDESVDEVQSSLPLDIEPARLLPHLHLRGLLEALVFASDKPMTAHELAKLASAPLKEVKEILGELRETYAPRGITLGEVAGGWLFRTNAQFAPFVRELTGDKPVRLSRAQLETLAIVAYRQPITRPEIDEIRGVDSGATMKLLLERELLRILGKKDEPGRPLLYGTTPAFLEFFGLKSLKELPTLREFAELSDESRAIAEAELGEVMPRGPATTAPQSAAPEGGEPNDTARKPLESADAAEPTEAAPDDALLADVPSDEERPTHGGEDGADTPEDDAALADVDEGPVADDTTITDPERVLGGDE